MSKSIRVVLRDKIRSSTYIKISSCTSFDVWCGVREHIETIFPLERSTPIWEEINEKLKDKMLDNDA